MPSKPFVLIVLLQACIIPLFAQPVGRENFDADWKFHLGDLPGAENPDFPDQDWRSLDLPHDWSIEGSFKPDHPSGPLGACLPGGIGWYRKSFLIADCKSKNRLITFDGVYMNSSVWINGHLLGHRPYGYSTFHYNLTPYLKEGTNLIAVQVDNSLQPNSRWYSGSGIYRHVWLTTSSLIHVSPWGTYVVTPRISEKQAQVHIETAIANDGCQNAKIKIVSTLLDAHGNQVSTGAAFVQIKADAQATASMDLCIQNPKLWDIEQPNLYTLVCKLYQEKQWLDTYYTPFGVRSIFFRSDSGFFLNHKWLKIKGVCLHHDLGCLGAAVNERALSRQLEILKSMGCNAVRTSHNPPAPDLLDLCDKMGILVMDEAFDVWRLEKIKYDYHLYFDEWHERDLADMVLRDRNHPCVILWSLGNEPPEKNHTRYQGASILQELDGIVKKYDKTRYTTCAFAGVWRADTTFMTDKVDVIGINYTVERYAEEKAKHPKGLFIASETTSSLSSRGVYHFPADSAIFRTPDMQCSSFDNCATSYERPWAFATQTTWRAVKETPYVAGLFVWTGFDYYGEPPYFIFPCISSGFGILDLCGFPKDVFYFYKSQWTQETVLHLLPHWNWRLGEMIDVIAYTNCDRVKLWLNEKFLGEQTLTDSKRAYQLWQWDKSIDLGVGQKLSLNWRVAFEPGTLRAEGYRNDKLAATEVVKTAGDARKIHLSADRSNLQADAKDLCYITVKILDREGTLVPSADPLLHFDLQGAGRIVGVANGNPISIESAQGRERRAFNGMCQVVIQTTGEKGEITLTALSLGLSEAKITVKAE